MARIIDDNQAFVLPYGRYLGSHEGKSVIQVSPNNYRETEEKWDGILKAIAEAPSLNQFIQTLRRAGVEDTEKYIDNLIANNLLAIVDMSADEPSLKPIYDWTLYPTLNYKGKSKSPAISKMIQIMITTPATKMPFNISILTTSILAEGLDDELILGSVAPRIISEFVTEIGMSETELKETFVSDLRKLFQRKGAFLG